MAIDFMVMPMSRYITGDYVTPTMRFAWSQGLPYTIVSPDRQREIPHGSPFGGNDAPARRNQVVGMIVEAAAGATRRRRCDGTHPLRTTIRGGSR